MPFPKRFVKSQRNNFSPYSSISASSKRRMAEDGFDFLVCTKLSKGLSTSCSKKIECIICTSGTNSKRHFCWNQLLNIVSSFVTASDKCLQDNKMLIIQYWPHLKAMMNHKFRFWQFLSVPAADFIPWMVPLPLLVPSGVPSPGSFLATSLPQLGLFFFLVMIHVTTTTNSTWMKPGYENLQMQPLPWCWCLCRALRSCKNNDLCHGNENSKYGFTKRTKC